MFNLKLSALTAGLAFILSFLIGWMNHAAMPALIFRPILFAILFFGLPVLITLLVNRFLPELLEEAEPESDILPGSKINIQEENQAAPPWLYAKPDESDESLGNISDAAFTGSNSAETAQEQPGVPGLDQNRQNGYNGGNKREGDSGFDVLPDLESLAGAFLPSSGNREEETREYQAADAPKRSVTGNKPQKLDGDFNPKDLASGIRTILKKQEG